MGKIAALPKATGTSLKSLFRKASVGATDQWLDGPKVIDDDTRWKAAARDGDRRYDAVMRLARERGRREAAAWAIAAILGGGWWLQAQKASVLPFFIPHNSIGEPGEVFVARPNEPPSLMRVWAAENIVKAMFAISSDGVNNADYQKTRESMLRGQAGQRWEEWFRQTSGTATEREIAIVSSKEKGGNVINVIWDEVDWREGGRVGSRRMNGDFTIEYVAPIKAGDIVLNKSGLFVTHAIFAPERGGVR